jgi:hypothetical protein
MIFALQGVFYGFPVESKIVMEKNPEPLPYAVKYMVIKERRQSAERWNLRKGSRPFVLDS